MLAGLPWTAWLLLISSVGIGLAVVLVFYLTQRNWRREEAADLEESD
jgi:hypothetical protein